jgi:leucyl aminopeptidase (aminopeptidase T)
MEIVEKARATLINSLGLLPSERALVLCDVDSMEIGKAFYLGAVQLTRDAYLMAIPKGKRDGDEPPSPVTSMMLDSQVIVAPTSHSLTYTNAMRVALSAGARIATMPGITSEMLERGGFDADYGRIARRIRKFGKMFSGSKRIRITSTEGTDLTVLIKGREWVQEDNGLCLKRGSITNLPAGEVFIAPVEESATGVIVFDGVYSKSVGEPVRVVIREGIAETVDGPEEVKALFKHGRCSAVLSEIGIGMNPNSLIIGNVLEDSKAQGTAHIGFGDNSTFGGKVRCDMHSDGVLLHPTVTVGKTKVIEDGAFILDL